MTLEFEPGADVGGYRITRELGRGGMGVVYEVVSPEGVALALKTLQYSGKLKEQLVERFKREIRAGAAVDHVNIARFIDCGKLDLPSGTVMWVVMELIRGPMLRAVIEEQRGRIDPENIARWCMQVAHALGAAHKRGIVHRDLKPDNVGLDGGVQRGHVKVIDFGIAKWRHQGPTTEDGLRLGTLAYMAPEQIEPDLGKIDVRTDIHALGVLLSELATGRNPFLAGEDAVPGHELHGRILVYRPPPLSKRVLGFPPDLSAIADKCMQKQQGARFQTIQEVADALETALLRIRNEKHASTIAQLSGEVPVVSDIVPTPSGESSGLVSYGTTAVSPAAPLVDITPPPVVRTSPGVASPVPQAAIAPLGSWTPGQPRTHRMPVTQEQRDAWIREAVELAAAESQSTALPPTAPFPGGAQVPQQPRSIEPTEIAHGPPSGVARELEQAHDDARGTTRRFAVLGAAIGMALAVVVGVGRHALIAEPPPPSAASAPAPEPPASMPLVSDPVAPETASPSTSAVAAPVGSAAPTASSAKPATPPPAKGPGRPLPASSPEKPTMID